jgi:hypothetical protein
MVKLTKKYEFWGKYAFFSLIVLIFQTDLFLSHNFLTFMKKYWNKTEF